jgi:hypothetical protein
MRLFLNRNDFDLIAEESSLVKGSTADALTLPKQARTLRDHETEIPLQLPAMRLSVAEMAGTLPRLRGVELPR